MKKKEVEKMLGQEVNYNEVDQDIDNTQQETPKTTEPENKPEKPKKKWSKKKIIATVTGGLVAAGAITVGVVKIFRKPNKSEETPAIDDSVAVENLLEVHQTPLLETVEKLTDTVSNLTSEKETEE